MSDKYRNQPDPNEYYDAQDYPVDNGAWKPSGYPDHYASGGYASHAGTEEDPFSAWRRPADLGIDGAFLEEEPMRMGVEMQQGGLPFSEAESDFRAMGGDAPTRLDVPVQRSSARPPRMEQETVSYSQAVQPGAAYAEGFASRPAQQDAQPRRRRSRMERREEPEAAVPQQNTGYESAYSQPAEPAYQPYPVPETEMQQPRQEQRPYRRTNVQDRAREVRDGLMNARQEQNSDYYGESSEELYSGARTAMPSRTSVQDRAREVRDGLMNARQEQNPDYYGESSEELYSGARTAMPSRTSVQDRAREVRDGLMNARQEQGFAAPQEYAPADRYSPQRNPYPSDSGVESADMPPRRPMQRPASNGQPGMPARRPAQQAEGQTHYPQSAGYGPAQEDYAARRPSPFNRGEKAASVNRKPYDFEQEEYDDEPRKGSALLAIVIVLLIIGGLLAGICLPDWENIGGPVGNVIAPVKEAVVTTFNTVKSKIIPEEELIVSFNANCSETQAPATVNFTVQTSKNTAGIRIVDDNNKEVYSEKYTDELSLSGQVMVNSNALIWKPSCLVEEEYYGGFTVYAQRKDGTEDLGTAAIELVSIAPPKEAALPMQGFESSVTGGSVPLDLTFTLTTSEEVTAVQVVDQYDSTVASMSIDDEDTPTAAMTQEGETRIWKLTVTVENIYNGLYRAQYRTDNDEEFVRSDYTVAASFMPASPLESATPEISGTPVPTETEPVPTEPEATVSPAATDTPAPTETPVPTPTPEPTPDASPMPPVDAAAVEASDPKRSELGLKSTTNNNGKSSSTFTRETEKAVYMRTPFTTSNSLDNYAAWQQAGVLTFRSGPMRQNASYKTVEVEQGKLSVLWTQEVGSMKTKDSTVYGVVAPGQPLIVKWPISLRPALGLSDEAKNVSALKEVIVAAQDGKIYFYNLMDGTATREPINMGAPSAGGLSLATNGAPVLGVGQSHRMLSNKTVDSGYHFYDLLTNKEALLVRTDNNKEKNSNYSGVLGAALFDKVTGTAFFGSQGGTLYSVELGNREKTFTFETDENSLLTKGKIALQSSYQTYMGKAKEQDAKFTNIDASIAMYDHYIYFGDRYGFIQCIDANTMTPVWLVDTGDKIDATPALDMEGDGSLALYTGNTFYRRYKSSVCNLRKMNALTGEILWTYDVPDLVYNAEYEVGLIASPVVGQNSISDRMIFTVTNGKNGSSVLALSKKDGSLLWRKDFTAEGHSSPVAVYNEKGDAWILQALSDGNVVLLDASTGEVLDTLLLEGAQITASPAVYGNYMIIGTTGKKNSAVYCIKIQ